MKTVEKKSERKEKDIVFSRAITYIMYQLGWSARDLSTILNQKLVEAGFRPRSHQAYTNVLYGVNGMGELSTLLLIQAFNEYASGRNLLKEGAKITLATFSQTEEEIAELFVSPKSRQMDKETE
ncbi:MAG: hypothetical protein ACI4U2_03880 [Christensenellaceae bacterium]